MGRQQYLSRLALVRSAFADADGDDFDAFGQQTNSSADTEDPSSQQYVQKYDSKGRPINPTTEARNTAMRNAENSALALVGVVERKDSQDRYEEVKYAAIRAEREAVLEAEQDAGETLELMVTFLSFTNYATETLIRRIQAGLYSPSDSLASIISSGWRAVKDAGTRGAFTILFPGAPAAIIYATTRVLLGATLSTGFEYFSRWLIKQKMRAKTARRVHTALYFVCEALLIGLDVILLPLEYHAYAQRLGLAPTWPIFPSWKILLPSHPTSFHQFGWHSMTTAPLLRYSSPAVLMLIQNSLWREQDGEIPVGTQLTQFEFPQVFNSPTWTMSAPKATEDPFGWVLYQGYTLRTKIMRSLGYNLEYRRDMNLAKYENDRLPSTRPGALDEIPDDASLSSEDDGGDGLQHIHRSTELAHLAPRYLANRLDAAYAKLLFLPLQALVVRSVAQSYMASLLPKTAFALSAVPHLYAPFTGVSFASLLRVGGWTQLGGYLSKLGLGLGWHVGNSLITFFLVSSLVRWQGRRFYDWGLSGLIGNVGYPTSRDE